MRLSKEEKDLLISYERGEWKSTKNFKIEKKKYQVLAKETIKKNKRINIRVSQRDLDGVQKKAIEEGLPYQTLIASIIHKYVSGRLIES